MEHIDPEERLISRWGRSDETESSKTPFVPDDVLYGKLRPYLKKVALADRFGVCSTEIIVLRPRDAAVTSEFLYYLCASPQLLVYAINHSAGTRMPRISPSVLLKAIVSLPSPDEQRRIVDLLSSVDAVSAVASARARAMLALKARFLGASIQELDAADRKPLGTLADIQSGISWSKDDQLPPGDPAGIGVMGVTNVQRDHVHADDCGWIRSTPQAQQRLITPHTILTIRTNGNADRIGNVHLAPAEAVGYTISSFLTSVTPHNPDDAEYILRVLQSPQVQSEITGATSGSTGLKNIAVTWIRQLEIPWPDEGKRRAIVPTASAFDLVVAAHAKQALTSRKLRQAMLTSVLTGSVPIPEAYDRLLPQRLDAIDLEPAAV